MRGNKQKMLRITMNKSAVGAKKYYCEEYYKEGQFSQLDYYSEKDELIGKWGGKAAQKLGLQGDIAKGDFASLCDNLHPETGEQLTARKDADRTVGYDFTFNASKSVSLAYAFGSEKEKKAILKAFQQSVRDTMTEIEAGMQTRVRGNGKNENRETGNIVYGEFTHFTTRPIDGVPDPHLHSHCFVFNGTFDADEKKWKAGQFRQTKQDAPYYEAVFHSKLAANLQKAGYGIERTENGFELAGIAKETLDKFSRRTKEIEDYSREHNIMDRRQQSEIGAKTREAKRRGITLSDQERNWLDRLGAEELEGLKNLRSNLVTLKAQPNEAQAAQNAVQYSLDHHLERKSVASDKEILATALKKSIGEVSPEQLKKIFNRNGNILVAKEDLRTFITTKDALSEEKQLIAKAVEAKNKFRPINENYQPHNQLLNDQQQAAVKHALSSTDGITIITGKAGTGKTTLMKEVKRGIVENGKEIHSFAPSSEASRGVQRSEGFENADTVAKLIIDKELQSRLKNQVIWIDEAGMLSNKDMNQILSIAKEQSARVILSGDTKQHSSVERGDALRILQSEAGIRPMTVDKIQRQKNAEYREAVKLFSDGSVEKGFKKLEQLGAIHEIADDADRLKTIAEDYYQAAHAKGKKADAEVLVIAPTHAEGEAVTEGIRNKLKEKNILGKDERTFDVLKNKQLTEAEKQTPEAYQKGNILVFYQNKKGIKAGNKLEVHGFEDNQLFATDEQGKAYHVPLSDLQQCSVFEHKQVSITQGDKIRITANGRDKDGKNLFNGSLYHIRDFDKNGNIRLSNGSTLTKDFGYFHLGYVSTSHSSQGKTADKVIVSQSSATTRASSMEQFYVSVSRGKQAVSVYTDDKEHLKQSVSQSVERMSATELSAKMREQSRASKMAYFVKWQKNAVQFYSHLKSKFRSNDGLQATFGAE